MALHSCKSSEAACAQYRWPSALRFVMVELVGAAAPLPVHARPIPTSWSFTGGEVAWTPGRRGRVPQSPPPRRLAHGGRGRVRRQRQRSPPRGCFSPLQPLLLECPRPLMLGAHECGDCLIGRRRWRLRCRLLVGSGPHVVSHTKASGRQVPSATPWPIPCGSSNSDAPVGLSHSPGFSNALGPARRRRTTSAGWAVSNTQQFLSPTVF